MSTIVIRPVATRQARSWDRMVATTLAVIAIALSLGLSIQNGPPDLSPIVDSSVSRLEPSAQARRLQELARDRAQKDIEIVLRDLNLHPPH